MFAGGADRLQLNPNLWHCGLVTVQDVARRVGNDQITWAASRDHDGQTDLPLNHNMGGISGDPLIGLFESASYLSYYVLSGIIIEADRTLENVVARRPFRFVTFWSRDTDPATYGMSRNRQHGTIAVAPHLSLKFDGYSLASIYLLLPDFTPMRFQPHARLP